MWIKILWIYGLAAVVSLVIAVLIKLIVVTLGRMERAPAEAPAAAPKAVQASVPDFDLATDHVAAISAAVYAVLGSVRIVHIEESRRRGGWLAEGRLAQHTGHDVPHQSKH